MAATAAIRLRYCASVYGLSSQPSSSMPMEKSLQAGPPPPRDTPPRPADRQVGRHPEPLEAGEVGMDLGGKGTADELVDVRAAELARRQTDAVDDQQVDLDTCRPRIVVGRRQRASLRHQTGNRVDGR